MINRKEMLFVFFIALGVYTLTSLMDYLLTDWAYYTMLIICIAASFALIAYEPREQPKTHYWVYSIIGNIDGNNLRSNFGILQSENDKFVIEQTMLDGFDNVVSFYVIEVDKESYERFNMLVNKKNNKKKDEDIHIAPDNGARPE